MRTDGTLSLRALEYQSAVCGRQTRNGALPSISQFVGIELGRPASPDIRPGLIGESAQGSLRIRKRLSPVFLVLHLAENPTRNSVLFLGRERRHSFDHCLKGSTHDTNYMGGRWQDSSTSRLMGTSCGRLGVQSLDVVVGACARPWTRDAVGCDSRVGLQLSVAQLS